MIRHGLIYYQRRPLVRMNRDFNVHFSKRVASLASGPLLSYTRA